jgi:hypothetical protein
MRVSVADAIVKLLAGSGIAQAVNPRDICGQRTRTAIRLFHGFCAFVWRKAGAPNATDSQSQHFPCF